MKHDFWNTDKITKLTNLVAQYTSNIEVAQLMNITPRQVKYGMKKYSIKRTSPKTSEPSPILYNEIPCKYVELGNCHEVINRYGNDKYRPKIYKNGKQYILTRYIWEQVNGPIPEEKFILYKCDNGVCININHLYLGTMQQNMQDKVNRNRQIKGTKQHNSKLNEIDVQNIRNLINIKIPYRKIASQYNVNYSTIQSIAVGKTWKER